MRTGINGHSKSPLFVRNLMQLYRQYKYNNSKFSVFICQDIRPEVLLNIFVNEGCFLDGNYSKPNQPYARCGFKNISPLLT